MRLLLMRSMRFLLPISALTLCKIAFTISASHMVLYLLRKYPHYNVVNFDKMDYCSSTFYFKEAETLPNYQFIKVRDNTFHWEKTSQSIFKGRERKNFAEADPSYLFLPQGDILSADLVQYVLKTHKIDTIMHFAAQSHVGTLIGDGKGQNRKSSVSQRFEISHLATAVDIIHSSYQRKLQH